jgi:hypothetical protein
MAIEPRADVRFEYVGAKTRNVADIVAYIIRYDSRVSRVVLGYPRLDLADKVGPDIGRFGEYPAAHPRE